MDTTLVEYMALPPELAAAEVAATVAMCRQVGGDAVILVHNDRVAGAAARSWYRDLVDTLAWPVAH